MPTTPLLLAVYEGTRTPPWNDSIDATLMILPPLPCAMNCRATAWAKKNTVFRLRSMTSSQSFSLNLMASSRRMMPALLTRMSMRRSGLGLGHQPFEAADVGQVGAQVEEAPAQRLDAACVSSGR
jgi:hypothetical protein